MSILNSLNRRHHLDDDAIAELWSARAASGLNDGELSYCPLPHESGSPGDPADDAHIQTCAQCRARYDALVDWLADIRVEAIDEADDMFPADRLATQQSQILRRLEALDRPARVIAFPRFARPAAVARRGPQRWIAAAAAAGLIVGLGAGELLDVRRTLGRGGPAVQLEPIGQAVARGSLQPVNLNADDAFLYDSEAASTSPRVEALQALDALTPRVRDVDQAR